MSEVIDLEVAAADFSSLTHGQKHLFVTEAIRRRRFYREWHVTKARHDKKELIYNTYGWSACLNKEELMMIGDLDQEEADNLLCKQFQKKLMMRDDLDQDGADNLSNQSREEEEEEEEEEDYVCISFQHRLGRMNFDRILEDLPALKASSYNEEIFVDARFNESDDDGTDHSRFVFRGCTVDLAGETLNLTEVDVYDYENVMAT